LEDIVDDQNIWAEWDQANEDWDSLDKKVRKLYSRLFYLGFLIWLAAIIPTIRWGGWLNLAFAILTFSLIVAVPTIAIGIRARHKPDYEAIETRIKNCQKALIERAEKKRRSAPTVPRYRGQRRKRRMNRVRPMSWDDYACGYYSQISRKKG
jgi:hypothetical protein